MEESVFSQRELEEDSFESSIRPDSIDEYIGQSEVKENLKIFIEAAKMRDETLDHVLLYGPPGLGKTTLAFIIANELGKNIKTASGPSIEKSGDLAAILSSLEKGDVLFGKRRAYQKKVAIAPFDGIFSAHGMVLRFPVFPESHCQTGPHSRLPHSGGGEIFTGSTILLMIFLPED